MTKNRIRPVTPPRPGRRRAALAAVLALAAAGAGCTARARHINPEGLRPSAFYSQAVIAPAGRTVYIAGQIGSDPTGAIVPGYAAQVRQAFANLRRVMDEAGVKPGGITKITVLIVDYDTSRLEPLGEELKRLFGNRMPASTLIPVPRLALDGMLFEIDAVGVIPR
jgi:enamine deaminase RidA (YjgF/YER057c/UK114 family)